MGKKRTDEKALREQLQRQRPSLDELVATGDYTDPIPQGEYWDMLEAFRRLKEVRENAGLTLAEMSRRTGMDQAAISRLENGVFDNPTINTLTRYARALDKRLMVTLVDDDAA